MASPKTLSANSQLQSDDEINLGALVRTLWRGKFWIMMTALLGMLAGGYYAFAVAIPEYTTSSVVMLESRQEQVVDLDTVVSGLSGDQASINTELEVFRARELMEKLVVKLDLTTDPEFNTRLRPEPQFSIGKAIGFVLEKIQGPRPPSAPPSAQKILDSTIDRVLSATSVSNVRQSYVFQITAVTQNAEKSAAIANQLAELYILDQLAVKFEATKQATTWLTARVAELQIALENSENAAKEFNAQTDLISIDALGALNRQVKDLRDRQANAQKSAEDMEAQLARLLAAQAGEDRVEMAALAKDLSLNRLLTQIDAGSPNAVAGFDARFVQILARTELDRDRFLSQSTALKASVTELSERIENQSNDLLKLQQLRREAEASRLIYEYFLGRLKETSVQQGIQQADSRLLSRAVVPRGASAPRKSMILALSLLFGAFVGGGLLLLREMSQTGIRTSEELENLTGRTVMGQIPMIPARRRKNVLQYLSQKPNSAASEAIRNLRTSVLLSNMDNPPQVIMSTSSLPGEGKTTQSLALTQNFAGLGKKVLLIEGDIRRRVFSQYFDIDENKGLLAVLSGKIPLDEAAVFNKGLGADVLIGEQSNTNAADVFSSKKFSDFLKDARKIYDIVIIDTPPVLVVPDARVIGQSVDAILYTVKWDSTSKTQVREGLRMFETVNLKVTGLVLGQIDAKGMKRYGYGGEYGAYGAYGNKYYHN